LSVTHNSRKVFLEFRFNHPYKSQNYPFNRRTEMKKFLIVAALAGGAMLGGCSTAQIENATTTIEGDIQAGTSLLCGVLPTLTSITSVVGAVIGQVEITTLSAAAEASIENAICNAAPTPASSRYRALPRASFGAAPASIGTVNGVPVTGWRVN
jgi:hypothetical protein